MRIRIITVDSEEPILLLPHGLNKINVGLALIVEEEPDELPEPRVAKARVPRRVKRKLKPYQLKRYMAFKHRLTSEQVMKIRQQLKEYSHLLTGDELKLMHETFVVEPPRDPRKLWKVLAISKATYIKRKVNALRKLGFKEGDFTP